MLKKGTAVVIMSSVFEHKESIETDKCVRFTRAPVAAFCLKLIVHYRAKTILKYHLNLFVCLMEGSGTKGNLALSLVNWQMQEIYESSRRCVLLEAHCALWGQTIYDASSEFVCLLDWRFRLTLSMYWICEGCYFWNGHYETVESWHL